MDTRKNTQFGLQIAIKVVKDVISEDSTPLSVVFANLLVLARSLEFPENLMKEYFTKKVELNSEQHKAIKEMLELMKSPDLNKFEFISKYISQIWVSKRRRLRNNSKQETKGSIRTFKGDKPNRSSKRENNPKKVGLAKTKNSEVKKTTIEYKKSTKKLLDK